IERHHHVLPTPPPVERLHIFHLLRRYLPLCPGVGVPAFRDLLPMLPAIITSDEPAEIRAIWGTTVNLAETMKLFRDFLKGFKPKYRVAYSRSLGLPTKPFSNPAD